MVNALVGSGNEKDREAIMKIVSVRADVSKNRLYTTLKGFLAAEDISSLPERLRLEAKKLKPGFIAISDVSEFVPASEKLQEILSQTMAAAVESGMGATIRVVSESAAMELQEISRVKHGYSAILCRTPEEAEQEAERLGG
jgi:hypothetical protein